MIKATYIDHMGSDLSVVNAARVSFGKQSTWEEPFEDCAISLLRLSERDKKLIHYLAKHKHLSPFGHAFASFHVKAPIFVARQLVKHKFLRWNEISRRYVDDTPEFYVPEKWRKRAENVKQGSSDEEMTHITWVQDCGYEMAEIGGVATEVVKDHYRSSINLYNAMLNCQCSPEQARMVLPQSTMTEWYWSGSLDAFAAMCKLRCASDTQYESRVVADQISDKMSELFPVSWGALMETQSEDGGQNQ